MTLEEAKQKLLQNKAFLASQNLGREDIEMLLAIIAEIERHREFLYERLGELP